MQRVLLTGRGVQEYDMMLSPVIYSLKENTRAITPFHDAPHRAYPSIGAPASRLWISGGGRDKKSSEGCSCV